MTDGAPGGRRTLLGDKSPNDRRTGRNGEINDRFTGRKCAMNFDAVKIKKSTQSEKGFTLVELVMAMAIMSILLTIYYSLFFTGGKQYEYVHDSYRKQNEARIAMSYITTKIRQNDMLISGTGRHAVSVQSFGSGTSLRIETVDDSGNREYEHIYRHYVPGGGTKLMSLTTSDESIGSIDPGSGSVIADNLNDVDFTFTVQNGNTCINVVIEYDSTEKGKFEETIVLRAK